MQDTLIEKPARLTGYALHRIAEQHTSEPVLWKDEGRYLRIRPRTSTMPVYEADKVMAFTVDACASYRFDGKTKYWDKHDWRSRSAWFSKQAAKHGFEVLGLHITAKFQKVETHDGRKFSIDATEFTGLLKITDSQKFTAMLQNGIGKTGKAFGLGLFIVS